ncbi:MAG: inositol monophosphatase [Calditrichaceae bacterium]|nr:inositol monophosphatase [Calditrichaceae bacterium]MBN2710489.1 inositol monophosphatase [Calditrichaceae bacterium]RQV97280.1 MAG: inositol monophosphatase [Calditrichota bacterium]
MIEIAKKAALSAGKIIMDNFRKLPADAVRKKAANDFLSFVDENSERAIIETIKSEYPDHAFHAEESGRSEHSNQYRWIIDPLDGTTNYIKGIPVFAVSIGLKKDDELVLGVIYDPVGKELFWAEKGKGAYLNDKPIRVTENEQLSDSFIGTGFPFKVKRLLPEYLATFQSVFNESLGIRRMGAAAVDLAYVAAGRFDGFWEIGLNPWDVAAGTVIIREAGGMVSDFWNKPYFLENHYMVATNGKIHQALCDKLQEHFPFFREVY